jgi:amino acid transporter
VQNLGFSINRPTDIHSQGTGLFLGSGQVIATVGPAGALLAYIFMGFVMAGVAYTTGEISAFMPDTGGFIRHATRFVEPALGAATGWNFCNLDDNNKFWYHALLRLELTNFEPWCQSGYTMAITAPAEISAAATVIQFWDTNVNPGAWITVIIVFIVALNLAGVRLYGEVRTS